MDLSAKWRTAYCQTQKFLSLSWLLALVDIDDLQCDMTTLPSLVSSAAGGRNANARKKRRRGRRRKKKHRPRRPQHVCPNLGPRSKAKSWPNSFQVASILTITVKTSVR